MRFSMRSSASPSRHYDVRCLITRFVLAMLGVAVGASQSMAGQEWTVTGVAGLAKEQHPGRGWDDSSLALGLSAGRMLSPSLSFEADLTYVPDMFPDNPTISAQLSVVNLAGSVLYDLTKGNWQPYLIVGAGFGRTRFTQPEFAQRFLNPPHWGPSVNAGGGVKRQLSPRTELRADFRYIVIRGISDVTDLWRVAGGLTVIMGR
jgi:hypothetical protein